MQEKQKPNFTSAFNIAHKNGHYMKVIISLSEIPGLVCIAQIGCFVHLDVGWIKGFRFRKQDGLRRRFIGVLSVVLCAQKAEEN